MLYQSLAHLETSWSLINGQFLTTFDEFLNECIFFECRVLYMSVESHLILIVQIFHILKPIFQLDISISESSVLKSFLVIKELSNSAYKLDNF